MGFLSIASVTCVLVFLGCHVTLTSSAKCQCLQRPDDYKFCNADFAITARIIGSRPSTNPRFKQYQMSIRDVLKESRGFPAKGKAVLQVPKSCPVTIRRNTAYVITGTFATYTSNSKFKPLTTSTQLLQTTACELVDSFQTGRYKSNPTFKNMINSWINGATPKCADVMLKIKSGY